MAVLGIPKTLTWADFGKPVAAVPSLHAGYAFVVFLFVAALATRLRRRWWIVGAAFLYPLLQATAVIYTADHYDSFTRIR